MNKEDNLFEEHTKISDAWSWAIIIGLALFLVFSGLATHMLLPDRPRFWQYGAIDATPGASTYSSMSPNPGPVEPADIGKIPRQLPPWPEALPLEKLKPEGYEMEEP